jgi:serine/threonine protein kinase
MSTTLLTGTCALLQIIFGVAHIESKDMQHGDLKSANILFKARPEGGLPVFKVADLGSATKLDGICAPPPT